MPNKLQFESSPYLLQHKDNPVDWFPWGEEALEKARSENKLIFISIGYSACHWCHVMERETFEDHTVAEMLNENFVSIKVDREERPDIDQLYMLALQLLSGQGGWPLNMICLPDTRPVYGGTYFRPEDFKNILEQLQTKWAHEPDEMRVYADRLATGVQDAALLPSKRSLSEWTEAYLDKAVSVLVSTFDARHGGFTKAPKFPLPNNWLFLLRYGFLSHKPEITNHVHDTLKKMAYGGIYDQVGGGFARYSVDAQWHIPHFEKMLYDNALLMSLYAEAYAHKPDVLYKNVLLETIAWLKREMQSPDGGFYSALDADSEGIEGKYYTFTIAEFKEALGADADLFIPYYNLKPDGNWVEEKTNVLYVNLDSEKLVKEAGFTEKEWSAFLGDVKQILRRYRSKRIKPGLDHKILCAWNAMMVKALTDVYRLFDDADVLEMARRNVQYIEDNLILDNRLLRQKVHNGKKIYGFLDDYAFYIEALIGLYEVTFEERWLFRAKEWVYAAIDQFYDEEKAVFYYGSKYADQLMTRSSDWMDDVIPSSNSTMVRQLAKLGLIFEDDNLLGMADSLTKNIDTHAQEYPSAFSNWLIYILEKVYGVYEVAICGPSYRSFLQELETHYLPNKLVLGGDQPSRLPLLEGKMTEDTKAYVCKDKTCSEPVGSVNDLVTLIFKQE